MMKTIHFGIEIETIGLNRQKLAQAIQSVVGGQIESQPCSERITDARGRLWQVVPDASLSDGYNSGEIVSPVLNYDDIEELQNVVRAVRTAGASVDASAAVHIHLDMSRFNVQSIVNLVKIVHKQERLLHHALGTSDARLTRYCRPIAPEFIERLEARRPKTMQELNEVWYGRFNPNPDRYDLSRYRGLNLNSLFYRGSLEFRFFNGTIHAGEVKAYIQLVLALAAKALSAKCASSKRREFDVSTAKYDCRVLLIGLGLVGDEFKTARLHLTKHLAGSAAWKGERRDRRRNAPAPAHQAAA